MAEDNWRHRSKGMRCGTCMYFVKKEPDEDVTAVIDLPVIGRCRRHSPSMQGWPCMFDGDWCGDHKLDENKLT